MLFIDPKNPIMRSPSIPLQVVIKKVFGIMETVSEVTYEDITMASGNVIRVVNSMTLGEIVNFIGLALLTLTLIFFFFSNQIWRGKDGNV
jgi:hypothetical protein